jgi:protein-tyrosine-phosphatase
MFVCVGNRNRSPFSQFVFTKMIRERDKDLEGVVDVTSAGFVTQELKDIMARWHVPFPEPFFGRPIAETTRAALRERGIAVPPGWKTRELTPEMVDEADFIVTALPVQKAELSIAYPEAARKIAPVREVAAWDDYLLSEDPHGLPHDNTFWDYVEENPGYVAKTMAEAEQMLIRAYPHILERLLAKKP